MEVVYRKVLDVDLVFQHEQGAPFPDRLFRMHAAGDENVADGDPAEISALGCGVILGEFERVRIVGAEHIGDGYIAHARHRGQQADRAKAVCREDAVHRHGFDGAGCHVVGVERQQVVVGRALQVADHAELAGPVQVYAVHVDAVRPGALVVEPDVLDGEVGQAAALNAVRHGIAHRHVPDFQPPDAVKLDGAAQERVEMVPRLEPFGAVTVVPVFFVGVFRIRCEFGMKRVCALVHVIHVPDSADQADVVGIRLGRVVD